MEVSAVETEPGAEEEETEVELEEREVKWRRGWRRVEWWRLEVKMTERERAWLALFTSWAHLITIGLTGAMTVLKLHKFLKSPASPKLLPSKKISFAAFLMYLDALYSLVGALWAADQQNYGTRWSPRKNKAFLISAIVFFVFKSVDFACNMAFLIDHNQEFRLNVFNKMKSYGNESEDLKTLLANRKHVNEVQVHHECCGLGDKGWLFWREPEYRLENLTQRMLRKVSKDKGVDLKMCRGEEKKRCFYWIPASCCRADSSFCSPLLSLFLHPDIPAQKKVLDQAFYTKGCDTNFIQWLSIMDNLPLYIAMITVKVVTLVLVRLLQTSVNHSLERRKPFSLGIGYLLMRTTQDQDHLDYLQRSDSGSQDQSANQSRPGDIINIRKHYRGKEGSKKFEEKQELEQWEMAYPSMFLFWLAHNLRDCYSEQKRLKFVQEHRALQDKDIHQKWLNKVHSNFWCKQFDAAGLAKDEGMETMKRRKDEDETEEQNQNEESPKSASTYTEII